LHLRPPSGWMGHWEQNMIEAGWYWRWQSPL
jgi:hypothetical protein